MRLISALTALSALFCLSACQTPAPHAGLPAASDAAPSSAQRTSTVLDAQSEQISQLQQQVAELNRKLDALQQQQQQLAQAVEQRAAARSNATATPAPTPAQHHSHEQAYRQALNLYQTGFYAQALRHLAFAERNGNGGAAEQDALFLLVQSHEKLRNCESVILNGQRFATRFPANPKAAEALYSVGNCQWNIQQRDIARDTWRKLLQTYPQSAAARRARERISSNR